MWTRKAYTISSSSYKNLKLKKEKKNNSIEQYLYKRLVL